MMKEIIRCTGFILLWLATCGDAGLRRKSTQDRDVVHARRKLVTLGRGGPNGGPHPFTKNPPKNPPKLPPHDKPSGALIPGLIQTNFQPMFETIAPNALDPKGFFHFDEKNFVAVEMCKEPHHMTGLVDSRNQPLATSIYGYRQEGSDSCTWPGPTFEVQVNTQYYVQWTNNIPIEDYLITSLDGVPVVDTSIHWAYSLQGYENYTISSNGVPVVPHHHGGPNYFKFDGRSEAFFTPDFETTGPEWFDPLYSYYERVAGLRWYHDHTLGLTRLNVYAGLAGFFVARGAQDTGKRDNPHLLPAYPYEIGLLIQDRMFKEDGSLFYPAFPGDPAYEEFIVGSGASLPSDVFPNGGPSVLAEFFGDVILVNGKIWPKMNVEPRKYRLRLLNGCDSRFLIVQFVQVKLGETEIPEKVEAIPFRVIGSDEGIAWHGEAIKSLVVEPAARYDVVFNFAPWENKRILMRNIGLDEPFTGYFDAVPSPRTGTTYLRTDRIMAFDVVKPLDPNVPDKFNSSFIVGSSASKWLQKRKFTGVRRVGLFEGSDSYGRILPLQGTVDPAKDCNGNPVLWPNTEMYKMAGLAGQQMQGTILWHSPITENIKLGAVEEWEIWNFSEDAHPIHLHLVFFETLGRNLIVWDSNTNEANRLLDDPELANGDGTFLVEQPIVMHDGSLGQGRRAVNPTKGESVPTPPGYFDSAPKDMVIVPPGQVTRIKAHFNKVGDYAWHCHILSHEDHAMMRPFYVCGSSP